MRVRPLMLLCALSAAAAYGQAPSFEVASVKRVSPEESFKRMAGPGTGVPDAMFFQGGPGSKSPERIKYSKVTLRMLLKKAYNLKPFQISGPGWLDDEFYEIAAVLPPGTKEEELRLMLQALLTERFRIESHKSSKTFPAYSLTVAKGGPKLKPALPPPPPDKDPKEVNAEMMRRMQEKTKARMEARKDQPRQNFGGGSFWHTSATLAQLAESLSARLDLPVVDKTGLEGKYSFELEWVKEGPNAVPGPSIYVAVEEQLGLKLQSSKEELELLVIDKAEKVPLEN